MVVLFFICLLILEKPVKVQQRTDKREANTERGGKVRFVQEYGREMVVT